jgi:hypothetical protein
MLCTPSYCILHCTQARQLYHAFLHRQIFAGVTRQELPPPAPGGEQQYLTALELASNSSGMRGTTTANAGGTISAVSGSDSAADASESEVETAKLRAAMAVSALFKRGLLAADAQPLLLVSATSSATGSGSIVEEDSAKHTSAAAALSLQVRARHFDRSVQYYELCCCLYTYSLVPHGQNCCEQ